MIEPPVSEPTLRRPEAGRGARARAGPTRLQHGTAIERVGPRIHARVVGVVGEAGHAGVVGHHRRGCAGGPVRQLGQHGLGDDDRAAVTQVLRQRRVIRRHQVTERQRAARGADVGGVDVVLQRDRNAVQGTANAAGGALLVHRVGLGEGARVHRDDGVQPVLVGGDARQVRRDQLARGDAPILQRGLQLGNARLHDAEGDLSPGLRGLGSRGARRSDHHHQDGEKHIPHR